MIALCGIMYKLSNCSTSCHTEYQSVVVNSHAVLQPFNGVIHTISVTRTVCYLMYIH